MLKNYLKVALRSIRKNKLYAGLNILGLSIGLSTFFIIYLFVSHELSYDQFHSKGDRIHRVIITKDRGYGTTKDGTLTSAFAPIAKENVPEVEAFSRVGMESQEIMIKGVRDSLDQVELLFVDVGFFQIFDLEFIAGRDVNALTTPSSVLISESKALKYFNTLDALGQTIVVSEKELVVDGIFKDLPLTTSLKADVIVSITEVGQAKKYLDKWYSNLSHQTYFLFKPEADLLTVEQKLEDVYLKYRRPSKKYPESMSLESLSNVHFSLDVDDRGVSSKSDRQYVYIFSVVGVFILLCAIFNYISLALSQSIERTKEVAIRKVVGAPKRELYKQFLTESILNVLISFVFAIVLVELLLPKLEILIDREIGVSIINQPDKLVWGLLFSLIIALVCAIYPAYLSTKSKVIGMLRGVSKSFSSARLIGAISIVQIVVFVTLICVAFTANRQMHFMRNEKLGFDKNQLLVIDGLSRNAISKAQLLKSEISKIGGVSTVSIGTKLPGVENNSKSGHPNLDFMVTSFFGDAEFFEVMGMTLKEGRAFVPEDVVSKNLIMINETLSQKLKLQGTVTGQYVDFGDGPLRIIGVVNDFHTQSKKVPVEAMTFYQVRFPRLLVVKLNSNDVAGTMDSIKEAYRKVADEEEASFFFLDDRIDMLYKQEAVMITVINTFVVISAIVAIIGLFGIAGYTVKRRLKEMGIRKVLGASFLNIQHTLNTSSFWKLLVAIGFAVPLVVLWMQEWLSSFAYRIEMPYFLIVGAIAMAVVIVFMAICFHSIKAYFINPVEILKDE